MDDSRWPTRVLRAMVTGWLPVAGAGLSRRSIVRSEEGGGGREEEGRGGRPRAPRPLRTRLGRPTRHVLPALVVLLSSGALEDDHDHDGDQDDSDVGGGEEEVPVS